MKYPSSLIRSDMNIITSKACLNVDGKDYPLLPLKYSGSVINNNTTGQLLGETLMDLIEKEVQKGERSPLSEIINNEEADIFMKGIKKGFDLLYGQLESGLREKSEQYYDAFSDQFPEDLFEYYALNNTP